MTLDEFFDQLAQTPRTWKVFDGQIRTDSDPRFCPICEVAGDGRFYSAYTAAANLIGLPQSDAAYIAAAADGCPNADPVLRRRLLSACGLLSPTEAQQ